MQGAWVGSQVEELKSHMLYAAAAAKSLQSCPTLCDPRDGSPPGSPDPGILQTRTLEWVAISFSNAWKWEVKVKLLSRVRVLATPWTAVHQAPPSMGFSRQEYWSGVPLHTHSHTILGRVSWLYSQSLLVLNFKYISVYCQSQTPFPQGYVCSWRKYFFWDHGHGNNRFPFSKYYLILLFSLVVKLVIRSLSTHWLSPW